MNLTHGSFEARGMAAHYRDLREIYAKRMECHGNGLALMQPLCGDDCPPVCCGYFDRNGDWNLIAKLRTREEQQDDAWIPLEYAPAKTRDISISWQPKTSLGVSALALDGSIDTPGSLPTGADAHIKYTSNNKFGAVLMTMKPITLHAYNDERLFLSWLAANRSRLYDRYGTELKRYGLWLVTRTYNAPGASINAWMDSKKDAIVSVKAKASMLGEAGEDFDWADQLTDKDWCHYRAKSDGGIVVFLDGIEVPPLEWWKQGLLNTMGRTRSRSRSQSQTRDVPAPLSNPSPSPSPPRLTNPKFRSIIAPKPDAAPALPPPETHLSPLPPVRRRPTPSNSSSPSRPLTLVEHTAHDKEIDDAVLQDAGVKHISRASSLRRQSYASSAGASIRSRSLRREPRSVSEVRDSTEARETRPDAEKVVLET